MKPVCLDGRSLTRAQLVAVAHGASVELDDMVDALRSHVGRVNVQLSFLPSENTLDYVRELIEWGAAFDREADGTPALGREAAHSVRRVLQ